MTIQNDLISQFHDYFCENPNSCVYLGVEKHGDRLPDPSVAHHEAHQKQGRALLNAFQKASREGLNFEENLDHDLAIHGLSNDLFFSDLMLNGKPEWQRKPQAAEDISGGMFQIFIADPRPAEARIDDITGRIEAIPDYLQSAKASLDEPLMRWVSMDLEKCAELPDLLNTLKNWANSDRLDKAIAKALPALDAYQEHLRQLIATSEVSTDFALGEEVTQKLIAARGIDKTLTELHTMAVDFLRGNDVYLKEAGQKLARKYGLPADSTARQVQDFLKKKYAVASQSADFSDVLKRYEAEKLSLIAFIRERSLFSIPENQQMMILQTPGFMEPSIPAGAMMSPAPFRTGIKTSLVYLTLKPELLCEHSEVDIPSMMLHEGIPGHHLQLTYAANHPSIIRRHMNAMDQAEGWTTMLEDYMLDQGYAGELADEIRFVTKCEMGRLGARVLIDLYFMTGRPEYLDEGNGVPALTSDPFANAATLLARITGFSAARVEAELNWYSQERGYPLSYLTGNRLVWALKKAVQDRHPEWSRTELDRRFHQTYLEAGSMPLKYLTRVFENRGLV